MDRKTSEEETIEQVDSEVESISEPTASSQLRHDTELSFAGNNDLLKELRAGASDAIQLFGSLSLFEAVKTKAPQHKESLEREALGRPSIVRYPDGSSRSYIYDGSGNRPAEIVHFDKNGKELGRINQSPFSNPQYEVKSDGTLEANQYKITTIRGETHYNRQGKEIGHSGHEIREQTLIHSVHPDGTHSDRRNYPDGSSREISYDKNGKATEYKFKGNNQTESWKRDENKDSASWYNTQDTKKEKPWIGTIEFEKSGRLIEKDKNGIVTEVSRDGHRNLPPDHNQWKEDLSKLAEKTLIDAKAKEQFISDMERIEQKVQEGKLSPIEAAKTYREVHRLMSTESQVGLSSEQVQTLARQVLHQTANPEKVDQGAYDNCNVSAPELRMYHREPSAVAKLVADAAITGKYTASNGQTVDISRSIQPANADHMKVPPTENQRSYASQICQVATINLSLRDKFPGQNLEYVQKEASANDSGARLLDKSHTHPKEIYSFGADGKPIYVAQPVKDEKGRTILDTNLQAVMTGPMGNPGLTIQDSINSLEKITGKKDVSCITHFEQGGYAGNWILDKVGLSNHVPRDSRIPFFENEAQLKKILDDAGREKRFPLILQVDSGSGFLGRQVSEASGKPLGGEGAGFGGGHVLCIKSYNSFTGKVEIDNTWGSSRDKLGKNAVALKDIMEISQTNSILAANTKEYHGELQAAYKSWCRQNNKIPEKDYPTEREGRSWLQKHRREK